MGNAIESVLYQTYPSVEIIVVDDGSTKHQSLLVPYQSHVKVVTKPNGGTASALNTGIQHAKGEYVAWLSSDDLFYPCKLSKQMPFMLEYNAMFSFTNFDMYLQDLNVVRHQIVMPFSSDIELYRRMLTGIGVNGCTAVLSQQFLQQIGLFDESLPYTHDYDFWVRIVLSGHRLYYLNESLTLYRHHSGMGSIQFKHAQQEEFEMIKSKYRQSLQQFIASQEKN